MLKIISDGTDIGTKIFINDVQIGLIQALNFHAKVGEPIELKIWFGASGLSEKLDASIKINQKINQKITDDFIQKIKENSKEIEVEQDDLKSPTA